MIVGMLGSASIEGSGGNNPKPHPLTADQQLFFQNSFAQIISAHALKSFRAPPCSYPRSYYFERESALEHRQAAKPILSAVDLRVPVTSRVCGYAAPPVMRVGSSPTPFTEYIVAEQYANEILRRLASSLMESHDSSLSWALLTSLFK